MNAGFIMVIPVILSLQVFPVALGIDVKKRTAKGILFGLMLLLGQVMLLLAGYYLGDRFMHLLEEYTGTVVFAGFFLVGIRFIRESFTIRKGERTYLTENPETVVLASLAQAVNTFLAGILLSPVVEKPRQLALSLLLAALIVITAGLIMKPGRQGLIFISLLYMTGGILLIFASVYLGFFG